MKRSMKRAHERAKRKTERKSAQRMHGKSSNYARKRDYLLRATRADENLGRKLAKEHGIPYESERRLFGFDFDTEKPWKSAA